MALKRTTTSKQIDEFIAASIRQKEMQIAKDFAYVGEKCVKEARLNGSYADQTGNLRSSIGYVVANDGEICYGSNFETVKSGSFGSSTGESYVRQLLSENNKGIVLIVVAGMNYAKLVSARGRDVLDSAEILADKLVPKMLRALNKNA